MDRFAVGGRRGFGGTGGRQENLGPEGAIAGYWPISDHGAIGNGYTGALVAHDGSIDWCCLPRFDSPSVFGAILDARKGGYFAVHPTAAYRARQRYIFDTNVLVTAFELTDGSAGAEVIDLMPLPLGEPERDRPQIHRLICGVHGELEMEIVFSPRLDYGLARPKLKNVQHGISVGSLSSPLALSAVPMTFRLENDAAIGRLMVKNGEVLPLVLVYGELEPRGVTDYFSLDRLSETQAYWRDWVGRCRYQDGWREQVMRSALVMKLLTYAEKSTIIGALTTSLPRKIGGGDNFDDRIGWIRDAALTLTAMLNVGYPREEIEQFIASLMQWHGRKPEQLSMVRQVTSDQNIIEESLPYLEGYRGAKPVVIGNPAARRFYLAPLGEILHSCRIYWEKTGGIPKEALPLLRSLADSIVRHWQEPDYGRWEENVERRQYTYSKVMCVVGLDAILTLAEHLPLQGDFDTWRKTREAIHREVMAKGWSERRQSFVRCFGDDELDSSALLFPLYGFIKADDPQMISTANQIVQVLGVNGLLRRFEGDESGFTVCSLWLADYFLQIGDVHNAEQLFGRIIDQANHLSLYSQAIDPKTREFLGNFPDVFSHIAFINTACGLSKALAETQRRGKP